MTEQALPKQQISRDGRKFLTFSLAREEYGLQINQVKEIIGMMPVSSVPQTPQFIKGVINLRGKVIPIIDLRLKFGMEETQHSEKTCIIVIEREKGNGAMSMGIIVDSVSEVLTIRPENIDPPPAWSGIEKNTFVNGIAKTADSIKMLLDIEEVLGGDERILDQQQPVESIH